MELNKRIEGIGEYFRLFNIVEGAIYILAQFPDAWNVPDGEYLKSEFKTQTTQDNNGIYFFTDLSNGPDCVFDAVECTIKFNKEIEEKMELLAIKRKELNQMFADEPIAKLRNLKFVISEPTELPKTGNSEIIKNITQKANKNLKDKKEKNEAKPEQNNEISKDKKDIDNKQTEENVLEAAKNLIES